MITVRAGSAAIGLCLVLLTSGCSREQQDWRSAEAADTIDSYSQFIQRHPESELVTQARTRVAQLGEDRDWQRAGSADTVDAYREFIAQHPSGKWAQEANIRIQNFSLGEQAGTDAATKATASPPPNQVKNTAAAAPSPGIAQPGEAATPARATPPSQAAGTASPPVRMASAANPPPAHAMATPPPSTSSTSAKSAPPPPPLAGASSVPPPPPTLASANSVPPPPPTLASAKSVLPPTPTPAAAQAGAAAKGGYGIQLGAFSSQASASAQWSTLSSKYASQLQGLQQHVAVADTGAGRVYRLQATVGDEGRARAICDQLRQHGQACVAVLPH